MCPNITNNFSKSFRNLNFLIHILPNIFSTFLKFFQKFLKNLTNILQIQKFIIFFIIFNKIFQILKTGIITNFL